MNRRGGRPWLLAALALVLGGALFPDAAQAARRGRRAPAGKTAVAAPGRTAVAPAMRFKVSNPNITQQLEIAPRAEQFVNFKLEITGGCQRTVAGVGLQAGGEALTGQDESGASYPVTEYRYKGKDGCYLAFRIDTRDGRLATVAQSDCEVPCPPVEDLMFRARK